MDGEAGTAARPARRALTAIAVLLLASSAVLAACGRPAAEPVRPLTASDPAPTDAADGAAGAGTPADPTPAPAPGVDGTVPEGAGPSGASPPDASIATAQDVLDRFDRALSELHRDPAALLRPADPLVDALAAVVPSGAVLADDVRSQVLDRLAAGESIPGDGDDDLAYVHHVTGATSGGPDRIAFTWCGWSPGVVVDSTSGAVVDDVVGHGSGTGVVERIDGTWMLASLDETSYDALPPGSPDPCPSLGAAS